MVDHRVSDETSNVAQTENLASTTSESRMPSTSRPARKGRKAAGDKPHRGRRGQTSGSRKTLRSRSKHKTTSSQHGARGIGFRLSREHVRLIDAKVQMLNRHLDKKDPENSQSDVLRSLLVTHLLVDNPHIDGVLFIGGYRACKGKKDHWVVLHKNKELDAYKAVKGPKGWYVTDRSGKHVAVATGVTSTIQTMSAQEAVKAARDVAFLRAEWLAQESTGSVKPDSSVPRKNDSKAFRLPADERIALQRLAAQNGTTVSGVLRSFLTTQLSERKDRLREVTIGPCRLYPCPEGWSIRKRQSLLQTVKTLKEAVGGAQWEASKAA